MLSISYHHHRPKWTRFAKELKKILFPPIPEVPPASLHIRSRTCSLTVPVRVSCFPIPNNGISSLLHLFLSIQRYLIHQTHTVFFVTTLPLREALLFSIRMLMKSLPLLSDGLRGISNTCSVPHSVLSPNHSLTLNMLKAKLLSPTFVYSHLLNH